MTQDSMKEFSTIKNKLLAEQIEEQLYRYIIDTPFEIGAKLPNEFELGEKFGVGRSTIREAVKLLISKGVLEVRRGSGTYVINTTPADMDPLGLQRLGDRMSLAMDLVDVRLLLEPGIAEMAARNATGKDIEELERLCSLVEQKMRNGEDYVQEDIAFHTCVAKCSQNKVVEQLIPIIDTAVMVFVNVTHKMLKEETLATHRAVVDSIIDRDPSGARTAMTMHMTYNRNLIRKLWKESQK